ncbi:MAG: hypothetical protein AB7U05_07130 [Mangrovibacterium sp.]
MAQNKSTPQPRSGLNHPEIGDRQSIFRDISSKNIRRGVNPNDFFRKLCRIQLPHKGRCPLNPISFLFLDEKKRNKEKSRKFYPSTRKAYTGPGQIFRPARGSPPGELGKVTLHNQQR